MEARGSKKVSVFKESRRQAKAKTSKCLHSNEFKISCVFAHFWREKCILERTRRELKPFIHNGLADSTYRQRENK